MPLLYNMRLIYWDTFKFSGLSFDSFLRRYIAIGWDIKGYKRYSIEQVQIVNVYSIVGTISLV